MAEQLGSDRSEAVNQFDLPPTWTWTKFEQLVRFSQNGLGKRRSDTGSATIVLRLADIVDGRISLHDTRKILLTKEEIEKYHLERDDLLCIRVNGSPNLVGRLLRAGEIREPVTFCDHFIRFQVSSLDVSAAYVGWYFSTDAVRRYIELNMVSSAGQNTVSQGTIGAIEAPLAPLAEQRRIVEAIEQQFTRLDAGVASLRRVQAGLRRYKAAVLKAACEGRLVPQDSSDEPADVLLRRILDERRAIWEEEQITKMRAQGRMILDDGWRAKYPEPQGADRPELPELPQRWMWARAEQLCGFITKGTTPSPEKLFSGSGDIPYIKVYNLTDNGLLDFTIKPTFINKGTHLGELARSRVFSGDVLMNIVGPPL